jgi:RHS repeat-associated protein
VSASFSYDAIGRRVTKTVNGVTKSFLFDGVDVVQEKIGGTPTANILTGGIDEFFSRTDSSGTWSPISDALGSTVALTDSTGTVQTSYTFDPFGQTTATGTMSSNPSKFSAREDDGTGLYYYRARYYSTALQRFVDEDPTGADGGINYYEYVNNDPINGIDPFGLSPQSRGARRVPWKGGRDRGGPRTGPRIDKDVPQCGD